MKRIVALIAAAGCATTHVGRNESPYGGTPQGAKDPVPQCAPMSLPAGERRAHVFSMTYVVRVDGSVVGAQMINRVEPALKTAALQWLTACQHQPALLDGAPVAVRHRREFLVRPANVVDGRIVDAKDLATEVRESIRPSRECTARPEASQYSGRVRFSFIVHGDGATSDLRFEDRVPVDLSTAVRRWVETCPYRSVEIEGEPVAVRIRSAFLFDSGMSRDWDPDKPPVHSPKMTRPVPEPPCTRPPSLFGLHGTAVLEYVVGEDGRARDFVVTNPEAAPPALVEAAEDWLSHCRFKPSTADGKPVSVRVLQPFIAY